MVRLALDFCLLVYPEAASFGPLHICNFELLNNQIFFSGTNSMGEAELLLHDEHRKPPFHSTIKVIFHENI